MTLAEIRDALELTVLAGSKGLDRKVTGGYASDLISDVMANAPAGAVWITLQGHVNTVAAALLKDLAGVILVGGRAPSEDTVSRADAEGLPLLGTDRTAFETAGRLYPLVG
jgi:predicted transcriptional regulator